MKHLDLHQAPISIAAAGLAVLAPTGMALAQASAAPVSPATPAASEEVPLTAQQQAQVQSWPQVMQTSYRAWPRETKAYFWSLDAEQQQIFWRLRQRDQIALTVMTGPEREAAWDQIAEAIAASAKE